MGMPMKLLRISAAQAELGGDALVRLLPFEEDERKEAVAARRLTGIDTAWLWLDKLFDGGAESPPGALLPVLGGRLAECSVDAPALVLEPAEVAEVAEFLAGASFDQLLAANRASVEAAYGDSLSGNEIDELREYFDDLKGFYDAARREGDAVMKWIAF